MLKKKKVDCWDCVGAGQRPEWFIELSATWFGLILFLTFLVGVAVGA